MSILIIQGPDDPLGAPSASPAVLRQVQAGLLARAAVAGQYFSRHHCRSEAELIARITSAKASGADIVLLDPGACSSPSPALLVALAGIGVPYIEVHDDRPESPERLLPARCGPLVAVVNGYAAQSYTLALSIALERLGCSECGMGAAVGT